MSQDYFRPGAGQAHAHGSSVGSAGLAMSPGGSPSGSPRASLDGSSGNNNNNLGDRPGSIDSTGGRSQPSARHAFQRPNYMTVGSGSHSQYAERLTEMLDRDSGYGSLAGGSDAGAMSKFFNPAELSDEPTPLDSPLHPGAPEPETDAQRRAVQSHIHQLHYNHNRTALGRAISRVAESLGQLQEYNREWPAHYPQLPAPAPAQTTAGAPDPRPGLHHTQSVRENVADRSRARPNLGLRRAETSMGDGAAAESSAAAASKTPPEPRLVTPQLARDFSVLKIDLKMDAATQADIIHSMKNSRALAQLLDGQISKSLRHLSALRERIEDTSSKVLVTGDLNAGKSTFCNALLRRKILPEDQLPCTSIFCEVLDVRDNGGVEEVHAVPIGAKYDRRDERTYSVHALDKLEAIVVDSDHYSQCKIYIRDTRSVDESLLNNGVLDIALIDAPGLNNDSLKTTAVFARQEEIDVVVFVVSAANHFTLSAREFIYDAAREKAYIFMVVNGFDNIRNKDRCQEQILKQVAHLSPATFKESSELVHFVSSNAVPVAPLGDGAGPGSDGPGGPGGASGGASGGANGYPHDSDDENDDDSADKSDKGKGKGKERAEQRRDFAQLEASLRRFVLEKRARSKLAPAKTYLLNVLDDLGSLATCNRDVAQAEIDRVAGELDELQPVLDSSQKARTDAGDALDKESEGAATQVYESTRDTLTECIAGVSKQDLGLVYPGLWDAYAYAHDLVQAMLTHISATVDSCEDDARNVTAEGVNMIKSLGLLHLGDAYADSNLNFQPDRMFRRRKDALARAVDVDIDAWDFFEVPSLWGDQQEKAVASTGLAVTVAGVLGPRLLGGSLGWMDGALGAARVVGISNLRRLVVPGVVLAVILSAAYAVAHIPAALPRRLNAKLAAHLADADFVHANARRISAEVARALKVPANTLRIGLQRNVEDLRRSVDDKAKTLAESRVARKYFGNLVREAGETARVVAAVDVDGQGLD